MILAFLARAKPQIRVSQLLKVLETWGFHYTAQNTQVYIQALLNKKVQTQPFSCYDRICGFAREKR